ncbi:phosphotransferase [Pseudoalteromonas sp. SMS1]|uniref:phosphotransferase n=1 Tax=Pseudoalteromonas sp. SMS1 TaxID=2908894 RepID=UPI001F3DC678|nr:phosphotransferase [Pseudoalteromonas sp. SMS1]MCF2856936.1 phosphotransferase [Pseudoalteromonas sp. SMS1]
MKNTTKRKVNHLVNSDLAEAQAILQKLYPNQQVCNVRKLTKGLSNQNFYFEHAGAKKLLKLMSGSVPVDALQVQSQLAKQSKAQRVIHIDEKRKFIVLEYLNAVSADVRLSQSLIQALSDIHQSKSLDKSELDLVTFLEEAAPLLKLESLAKHLVSLLTKVERDICFCHNDLVKDNIIETANGPCVIDFEYAQNNDLYFDLAALCCSFSLSQPEKRALIKQYYETRSDTPPIYAEDKLEIFIGCYLILSMAWYFQRQEVVLYEHLQTLFNAWYESFKEVLPRGS